MRSRIAADVVIHLALSMRPEPWRHLWAWLTRGAVYSFDPQFSCSKCAYMWPCPTYLWAVESEPFTVHIAPKVKP